MGFVVELRTSFQFPIMMLPISAQAICCSVKRDFFMQNPPSRRSAFSQTLKFQIVEFFVKRSGGRLLRGNYVVVGNIEWSGLELSLG